MPFSDSSFECGAAVREDYRGTADLKELRITGSSVYHANCDRLSANLQMSRPNGGH
jgi:hypothetical protein